MRRGWWLLCGAVVSACATPAQVRRVESEVSLLRADQARGDSLRALQLSELTQLSRRAGDSLSAVRQAVALQRGDVANDLTALQQQMLQLKELIGQIQQRLTELRTEVEASATRFATTTPAAGDTSQAAPAGAVPSAEQMFQASVQQLKAGRNSTARSGLRELLRVHPTSERAPEALYFIGQSFEKEKPDSAAFYYNETVTRYPSSSRAASGLYQLGVLAEARKDAKAARGFYQRVVDKYPKADEAALAREKLRTTGR